MNSNLVGITTGETASDEACLAELATFIPQRAESCVREYLHTGVSLDRVQIEQQVSEAMKELRSPLTVTDTMVKEETSHARHELARFWVNALSEAVEAGISPTDGIPIGGDLPLPEAPHPEAERADWDAFIEESRQSLEASVALRRDQCEDLLREFRAAILLEQNDLDLPLGLSLKRQGGQVRLFRGAREGTKKRGPEVLTHDIVPVKIVPSASEKRTF